MLDTTRISSKVQVVIPKRVWEALGLEPGGSLLVGVKGDMIVIHKLTLEDLVAEPWSTIAGARPSRTRRPSRIFSKARCPAGPFAMTPGSGRD